MKNDVGKILVLRYGTNIIDNCIERHISVINENGYWWFAKLGRAPARKALNEIFSDGKGTVILYSRSGCYICEAIDVSEKKPLQGIPDYYETHIFQEGLLPSIYIKLKKIKK